MKKYFIWLFGLLFIAAGVNHFISLDFYTNLMPPYIPWHEGMVIVSGVIEIVLGIAFLFSKTRKVAAWGIVALLVAVLPAHFYMIEHPEVIPQAPLWFLYARFPIQFIFGVIALKLAKDPVAEEVLE